MIATHGTGWILALACVGSAFAQAAPPETPKHDATLAIEGVTVIPMDRERALRDHTVLVSGASILAVGPDEEIEVGADVQRIDGRGKFLIPGLAEMHGHLPTQSRWAPKRWSDDVLFLYLANGVTFVRGMYGQRPHLELRERIEKGETFGPRVRIACPPLTGNFVKSAEIGAQFAREFQMRGFDLLKIHEGLAPDVYDAIAATAQKVGIPFGGHVPDAVGARRAIEAGQRTIDHLDGLYEVVDGDVARIPEVVELLRRHDSWVVPTEVLWEVAVLGLVDADEIAEARPETRYAPREMVARWIVDVQRTRKNAGELAPREARRTFRRKLIQALARDGRGLLLGTDSPQVFSVPGFSMHHEMQALVASGLRPFEVLESATRLVGVYYEDPKHGTIAPGHHADLVLLDADPLRDIAAIRSIAGVLARGTWLDAATIRERLTEIESAYRE